MTTYSIEGGELVTLTAIAGESAGAVAAYSAEGKQLVTMTVGHHESGEINVNAEDGTAVPSPR